MLIKEENKEEKKLDCLIKIINDSKNFTEEQFYEQLMIDLNYVKVGVL